MPKAEIVYFVIEYGFVTVNYFIFFNQRIKEGEIHILDGIFYNLKAR